MLKQQQQQQESSFMEAEERSSRNARARDPFLKYREMYPTLDIDEEYRKCKIKRGFEPGRSYFEGWLRLAIKDQLDIPEYLKEKPKGFVSRPNTAALEHRDVPEEEARKLLDSLSEVKKAI